MDDDMSNTIAMEFGPQGPQTNKPKKRHTGLIVFITLLIGIIIGGGATGFYLVEIDNPFEKKDKKVVVKKEENKKETLDGENYLANSLVERLHNNTTQNLEFKLYASNKTEADDLDTDYVNYLVVNEAKRETLGTSTELSSDIMQKALNNIFGETSSFVIPKEDFGECPKYTYNTEEDSFTESTTKATLEDNTLEVYEAVAFFNNKEQKVYTEVDANGELSKEVKNFDTSNFLIERDANKTNTYKYTFEYNEDTSNYEFKSITLEK